jgi:hypothetical protein
MGLRNGSGAASVHALEPRRIGKPGQHLFLHTETESSLQYPSPSRLRLLARQMYSLGERPLFEYLAEIIAGSDPVARLEAYARLSPLAEFIAVNDGDRLAPPRLFRGGRR